MAYSPATESCSTTKARGGARPLSRVRSPAVWLTFGREGSQAAFGKLGGEARLGLRAGVRRRDVAHPAAGGARRLCDRHRRGTFGQGICRGGFRLCWPPLAEICRN